jgi:transaldolase
VYFWLAITPRSIGNTAAQNVRKNVVPLVIKLAATWSALDAFTKVMAKKLITKITTLKTTVPPTYAW